MQQPKTSSKRLQDFELLKQLGRGAYGTVYQARQRSTQRILVIKMICLRSTKAATRKTAFRQVSLMRSLNHPNIIRYEHSFYDEDNLYIVMEYAEKGDLSQCIKTRKYKGAGPFSEAQLWRMAEQLVSGLNYLHGKSIIHRDIKTSNIFIAADGTLKIGDLGVSKILNFQSLEQTRIGTPLYLAPELIRHQQYDFKVDMWGLGCILYLLATLEHPFNGRDIFHLGDCILKEQPKPLSTKISEPFHRMIKQLLEKNSKNRADCASLLSTYSQLKPNEISAKQVQQPSSNTIAFSTKSLLKTLRAADESKLDLSKTKLNMGHSIDIINSKKKTALEGDTRQELSARIHKETIDKSRRQSTAKTKRIDHSEETGFKKKEQLVRAPSERKTSQKAIATQPKEPEIPKQVPQQQRPKAEKVFDHRRPLSAAMVRSKPVTNNVTLKDLLKMKGNVDCGPYMQKPRYEQVFSQLEIALPEQQDAPLIEREAPQVHLLGIPSRNGLQPNRHYKQRPFTTKQKILEKGLCLSKSFARPKCPTIELRKADLLAVQFSKQFID